VKHAGLKVWLTVHYSDTWADPGVQNTLDEWKNLSFANLTTAGDVKLEVNGAGLKSGKLTLVSAK
jgi:hypothetical protein